MKETGKIKNELHPRNKNREDYDLESLVRVKKELKAYIILNKYGNSTIDFSNPKAVKLLNQAILLKYYGIENWDFPDENLCPPIPGRADYIHYLADLLKDEHLQNDKEISVLDIGTGASSIYPILGVVAYDWSFVGTDIDEKSIISSRRIVAANKILHDKVVLRLQPKKKNIFLGIIEKDEKFDLTMCNPPFHSTAREAKFAADRKVRNLSHNKAKDKKDKVEKTETTVLNFSGKNNELIYEGGELKFIQNMILESEKFAKNCYWFTTLVSKETNLKEIYKILETVKPNRTKEIALKTGNKSARIVAWSFLNDLDRQHW